MAIEAVIIRDKLSSHPQVTYKLLRGQGIDYIEIDSLLKLEEVKPLLDPNKPFLLYRSDRWYCPNPRFVLDVHAKSNGTCVAVPFDISYEFFSFYPHTVKIENNKLELNINNCTQIPDLCGGYLVPDIEPPRIVCGTHDRPEYLKLSLNSLFHSIRKSVPITLVLNEPSVKAKEIAREFYDKHENLDVLEVEENSYLFSTLIAIEWYKPKIISVWEDDIILPTSAKRAFPFWAHQFAERLDHVGITSWSASLCNDNMLHLHSKDITELSPMRTDWYNYSTEDKTQPTVCGHGLTLKSDLYLEGYTSNISGAWGGVPTDNVLKSMVKNISVPSTPIYHIGWNSGMDTAFHVTNTKRFPKPLEKYTVTEWRSGEKRIINVKDIKRVS